MIISASRRTDIPAFYGDWMIDKIIKGYVYVRNPFNPKQIKKVSLQPEDVECIVFWTKNPEPFITKLKYLQKYHYYFLYTITPYAGEFEKAVPELFKRIEIFKRLSDLLGKEKAVWRYDPVIFSDDHTVDYHLDKFHYLCQQLAGYTEKCIISFLTLYKKRMKQFLEKKIREAHENEKMGIYSDFRRISCFHNIQLETCAITLQEDGEIVKSPWGCINHSLIERITRKNIHDAKDKNQRKHCNCIRSIDIGEYNTCLHDCIYCYANQSNELVKKRKDLHEPGSPYLIG